MGSENDKTSALGSAVVEAFNRDGYYIHRGLFSEAAVEEARTWLAEQDPAELVKSWTEQEPGVPLAVFSVIHKDEHPISGAGQRPADARHGRRADGLGGVHLVEQGEPQGAWCGSAEYYHQDLVYWKDRGYPRDEMLSCMIFLDPHRCAMRRCR